MPLKQRKTREITLAEVPVSIREHSTYASATFWIQTAFITDGPDGMVVGLEMESGEMHYWRHDLGIWVMISVCRRVWENGVWKLVRIS